MQRTRLQSCCSISLYVLTFGFAGEAVAQHHGETAECGDPAPPLLSVGDFDGDGVVTALDVDEISTVVEGGGYYALYDRNADGVLDGLDVSDVATTMGAVSTEVDRELAAAYKRFMEYQEVTDAYAELIPEFQPSSEPFAGHGVHWVNDLGAAANLGYIDADFGRAEGLNIPADGSAVWGMFWGQAATPVFDGGADDWPTPGGAWEEQHVVGFAEPPPVFTSSPHEMWHRHVALCTVVGPDGRSKSYEHTTWQECQEIESLVPTAPDGVHNVWVNLHMLHVWLFNLNPNGVFGGVHPCIDPWAPPLDI